MESVASGGGLPAETAESGPGKPARARRPLVLIVVAGCALLGLVFAALWFTGIFPKRPTHGQAAQAPRYAYVPVPEIITNLAGREGEEPYAKLKVMLEVPADESSAGIDAKLPQIVDMFQLYVRAMHPAELQGAEGTYRLKEALVSRANIILGPNSVKDVLFQEIIVQ